MNRRVLSSTLALAAVAAAVTAFVSATSRPALAVAQAPAKNAATWAVGGTRERLTPDNCVIAFIDHQTGLMNLVDNVRPLEFKNIVVGLAKTAKLHGLPVVLTTSAEAGPNGPFVPEVVAIFPSTPIISRPGQINAWDNPDFVEAIKKTGRKKIVMSGITTDVCVAFAALSALDAGYEVYVVVDASGCMNAGVQDAALMRMSAAGATIGTWFGLVCELLSDWRNPGGPGTARLLVEHMPSYAEVFSSHKAHAAPAASNGR